MIIGISGKLGSGKDLAGLIVQYLSSAENKNLIFDVFEQNENLRFSSYEVNKFADCLKDMVCMLINCSRIQLEDRNFKEKELGEEWWVYTDEISMVPYIGGDTKTLDEYNIKLQKTTPRLLMQLLGTDCGREMIHPNIWVNSLMSKYIPKEVVQEKTGVDGLRWVGDKYPDWVITDVRFPNEADVILAKGGKVLRVNRPNTSGEKLSTHSSETALDNYARFTAILENDGTKQELIDKIRPFV